MNWLVNITLLFFVLPCFGQLDSSQIKTINHIDTSIVEITSEPAKFPGGDRALYFHFANHTQYPIDAMEKGIQGRVFVKFMVEIDGSISHVKVIRGVFKSLDEEAVRLIKSMPKWTPAQKNYKPVQSTLTIPVSFLL